MTLRSVYEKDSDLSTRPKKYLYSKANGNKDDDAVLTPVCIRFKREKSKKEFGGNKWSRPCTHVVVQHESVYGVEPG